MPPLDELDLVYIARLDQFQFGERPIALTTRLAAGARNGSVAMYDLGWPNTECRSRIPPGMSVYSSRGAQTTAARVDFSLSYADIPSWCWWCSRTPTLQWGKLGITLSVTGISASMPKELLGGPFGRAATWGLLGNYDGDKRNDRQYPNGTVDWQAPVDLGSLVYHPRLTAWWESWRVSALPGANSSMVTKLIGPDSCVTGTPRVLEARILQTNGSDADARVVCGINTTANISDLSNSLQACYADVVETGDPAFGLDALHLLGSAERAQASAEFMPTFIDPSLGATYSVSLNDTLVIYFSAEARNAEDNDFIIYSLVSGMFEDRMNRVRVLTFLFCRTQYVNDQSWDWNFHLAWHSSVRPRSRCRL